MIDDLDDAAPQPHRARILEQVERRGHRGPLHPEHVGDLLVDDEDTVVGRAVAEHEQHPRDALADIVGRRRHPVLRDLHEKAVPEVQEAGAEALALAGQCGQLGGGDPLRRRAIDLDGREVGRAFRQQLRREADEALAADETDRHLRLVGDGDRDDAAVGKEHMFGRRARPREHLSGTQFDRLQHWLETRAIFIVQRGDQKIGHGLETHPLRSQRMARSTMTSPLRLLG